MRLMFIYCTCLMIYFLYLFIILIHYIYLFIHSGTLPNCLFLKCSQCQLYGIFMYPSMLSQFNVYKVVEKRSRMYLLVTLELLPFIWDILSLTKTLPDNFKFISSWDLVPRF